MTKLSKLVAILCIAGLAQIARAEIKNPPTPLNERANELKPKVKALKDALKQAISDNKLDEGLAKYNRGMAKLKEEFVTARTQEYEDVREVIQHGQLAAEIEAVAPTKARKSDNKYDTYEAPAEMTFDSLDWREVSSYGNTKREGPTVTDGGKKVGIHLNARSLVGIGKGRSRIEIQPKTTWRYSDPTGKANADWDKVNELLNQ